jgi:hypothetical protein
MAIAPIFEGQTWDNFEIPEYKTAAVNGAESQSENTKPEITSENTRPDGRPEIKPDVKPEANPEANPEIKAEKVEKPIEVVERKDSKTSEVDKYVDALEESKP